MKVGDVVVLKSGGPLMTVHSVENDMTDPDAEVTCVWFDNKNESHIKVFPVAVLKASDEA